MNRRAEDDVHLHLDPCLTCAICRRFIIEEEDQVLARKFMKLILV